MKVLSLFDGISCGYIALQRAGFSIEKYVAYEINPYAIKVSLKNHPDIIQMGDVYDGDFTEYKGYDLLMGGSPCTNWSIAKCDRREENLNVGRSLFAEYVRALHEVQPKYFLFENNFKIGKEIVDEISSHLGVEPILIDSALVSGQKRQRLYWTNIPDVNLPEDRGILFNDVIDKERIWREIPKYMYGTTLGIVRKDKLHVLSKSTKSNTITTADNHPGNYYLNDDKTLMTSLKPHEFEKLQTIPVGYTEGLSTLQRCKCLGNAWTVDVIAHILSGIKHDL